MGTVSHLSKRLPSPLQRAYFAIVPFSIRYGKEYRKFYNFISGSQWWSTQELQMYQLAQLGALLEHAYTNVPYYRNVFDERKLKPKDIHSLADLTQLPILTRDIIRENFDDLIARNYPRAMLKKFSTSGSSGKPLIFLGEDRLYKAEAAFITRAFSAHGAKLYDEKTIWLRRYVPEHGGPIFKHDYELNRLYLSAYHLSRNRIKEYVTVINNYPARMLVGYPSSLYILAMLLEESGLKLQHIQVAHAASEKMLPEWKEKIESVLGIPVKNHYGMVEKVCLFFQCDHSSAYHESLEYGITEFVNREAGVGQVVGTSFLNYAMPFIRYQMNDSARINNNEIMCTCGRGLPLTVEDFEGRTNDILVTADGQYIPGVNFFPMMAEIPGIRMFQIIQYSANFVLVKIVPSSLFDAENMKLLKKGLENRLGSIEIEIKLVDEIQRNTKTGKIRCIVNNYVNEVE